MKDLCYSLT
jgi:hypothetical protein